MLVAVASELRMVIVMSALRNRRDKEMTNREKYAKEILDIACSGDKLAMRKADKRLTGCNKLECNGCCFSGTGRCSEVIQKWAESEYIESPVISKADRAFLEYFIEKYKYIARDENGNLIVYVIRIIFTIKVSRVNFWLMKIRFASTQDGQTRTKRKSLREMS